jgi:hypothetical protein
MMRRFTARPKLACCLLMIVAIPLSLLVARVNESVHRIDLPTGRSLTLPVPGFLARTNSFPETIAISPDRHYAALLNQGYGTQEAGDAHAPLMAPLFIGPGTQPPYEADDRNLRNHLMFQMNATDAPGAKQSSRMNFSRPDLNDAQELNAILWQDSKPESHLPNPAFAAR